MTRTGRTFENLISSYGLALMTAYLIQESETFAEGVWKLRMQLDGRCIECGYKLESMGHENSHSL